MSLLRTPIGVQRLRNHSRGYIFVREESDGEEESRKRAEEEVADAMWEGEHGLG